MLFVTKTPRRDGRGNRHKKGKGSGADRLESRQGCCGIGILSADKPFLGNENVPTLLNGTERRPDVFVDDRGRHYEGWFVVEQHDNLDEILTRTLAGPFATEQEAERVAGWRRVVADDGRVEYVSPTIEAPELVSMPDDVADLIAAQWRTPTQEAA